MITPLDNYGSFTFAIVKPDAVARGIEREVWEMARPLLTRVAWARLRLSRFLAQSIYLEHADKPWIEDQLAFMMSGPVEVAVLVMARSQMIVGDESVSEWQGVDAVSTWRNIIGATAPDKRHPMSIRGRFADGKLRENCAHGSDSAGAAFLEASIVFGRHVALAMRSACNARIAS